MSRNSNFKNKNKKISKVKRNTYNNSANLVKQQNEESKNTTSLVKQQTKKEENKKVNVSFSGEQQQAPDNSQSKFIMITSFACLGFIFTFLANYGFFDLQKALLAGFWGFAGGAAFAYFPYWLASREN